MSALDELKQLRAHIEGRLARNDDYRALLALDKAIREMSPSGPVLPPPKTESLLSRSLGSPIGTDALADLQRTLELLKPIVPPPTVDGLLGFSQADAVSVLLANVLLKPTPVSDLVELLTANGITVGGKDPALNLSSVLSKDGRFRSVRFEGRQAWWLNNRRYIGETAVDEKKAGS